VTTGTKLDLKKSYELAFLIIAKYGMSKDIGYIGFVEQPYRKGYSEETSWVDTS